MSARHIFFQFLGFFLQLLPLGILYPVPFADDALLLPRRRLTLLLGCGIALLSAGFAPLSWLVFGPAGRHGPAVLSGPGLYLGCCVFLCAGAFFAVVQSAAMKKIVVLALLIHYAAGLAVLSRSIAGFFPDGSGAWMIYGKYDLLADGGLLAVTLPFVYLFLARGIGPGLSCVENRILKRSCIYLLLALPLFILGVFQLERVWSSCGFSEGAVLGAVFLSVSASILTDCILYAIFFAEARLAVQIHQREEMLRSFDERYREICSGMEEARRARHDIRHHLNLIGAMDRRGAQGEAGSYLNACEASFRGLEEMSLSGYPVFDSILRYHIESASRQKIQVRVESSSLGGTLPFDVTDLAVLLGNLMENAIEACKKLPPDALRPIRIWARQTDAALLLEVENACADTGGAQPDFTDHTGFITTKHGAGHGQGLKSIQHVAEKYGGSAEFKKMNGLFTARIVLYIP